MLDAYTIIGFIGALVLMVGFLMNQLGRWQTTDFEYDFINLIGAAVLSVYAWQIGSYPFLVLFIVWTLFSIKDVIGDGFANMKKGKIEQELQQELEKDKETGDNAEEK
ncbi:hypothetical protein GF369_00170 [Candidatus Peregrinibacteria bacterium]|nr:hypothetical protein [Candidatus Peregrinibacteria bacterium]